MTFQDFWMTDGKEWEGMKRIMGYLILLNYKVKNKKYV